MAVTGKCHIARIVEIVALGVGEAVGRAQGKVVAVIGQADIAPVAARFLRFQRVGERKGRRREAVDIERALAPVGMGEEFEVRRDVEKRGSAQPDLFEAIGLRTGGRGGETVCAVEGAGEPGEVAIAIQPRVAAL